MQFANLVGDLPAETDEEAVDLHRVDVPGLLGAHQHIQPRLRHSLLYGKPQGKSTVFLDVYLRLHEACNRGVKRHGASRFLAAGVL
jgi:hypothetical protein